MCNVSGDAGVRRRQQLDVPSSHSDGLGRNGASALVRAARRAPGADRVRVDPARGMAGFRRAGSKGAGKEVSRAAASPRQQGAVAEGHGARDLPEGHYSRRPEEPGQKSAASARGAERSCSSHSSQRSPAGAGSRCAGRAGAAGRLRPPASSELVRGGHRRERPPGGSLLAPAPEELGQKSTLLPKERSEAPAPNSSQRSGAAAHRGQECGLLSVGVAAVLP